LELLSADAARYADAIAKTIGVPVTEIKEGIWDEH
jgi:hypothetical protein